MCLCLRRARGPFRGDPRRRVIPTMTGQRLEVLIRIENEIGLSRGREGVLTKPHIECEGADSRRHVSNVATPSDGLAGTTEPQARVLREFLEVHPAGHDPNHRVSFDGAGSRRRADAGTLRG